MTEVIAGEADIIHAALELGTAKKTTIKTKKRAMVCLHYDRGIGDFFRGGGGCLRRGDGGRFVGTTGVMMMAFLTVDLHCELGRKKKRVGWGRGGVQKELMRVENWAFI